MESSPLRVDPYDSGSRFDEWWNDEHSSTPEFESDVDECEEDCYEDRDEY